MATPLYIDGSVDSDGTQLAEAVLVDALGHCEVLSAGDVCW